MRTILQILGLAPSRVEGRSSAAETETVRKIVAELDHMPPERAAYVAAFAYLLGRVAHADLDIVEHETREMERIVAEHGSLPVEQAIIVVQMAKTQGLLFGGTENFLVAREFEALASREQKKALIDCLFAVSAADGSISTVESNVIRQIADELKLDRGDFIAVRTRYRDQLAVLRPAED